MLVSKIQSNTAENISNVIVELSETGYANLIFPFDKKESWKLTRMGS
jgi:hypothetical protein